MTSSPNIQLRDARLARPSPTHPDCSMTRRELADAVTALVFVDKKDISTPIDANYIGKLERGVIRWPCPEYRHALRTVLEVATDQDLGFHQYQAPPVRPPGPRRMTLDVPPNPAHPVTEDDEPATADTSATPDRDLTSATVLRMVLTADTVVTVREAGHPTLAVTLTGPTLVTLVPEPVPTATRTKLTPAAVLSDATGDPSTSVGG